MTEEQFDVLIGWAGGKSALARAAGVTPGAVTHWRKRGFIPADSAIRIERASAGRFKAVDMVNGE